MSLGNTTDLAPISESHYADQHIKGSKKSSSKEIHVALFNAGVFLNSFDHVIATPL